MAFDESLLTRLTPFGGKRKYNSTTLNQAFNDFLQIRDSDLEILDTYRDTLLKSNNQFTDTLYRYLKTSPATAETLSNYQAAGGEIVELVEQQLCHLNSLLLADMSNAALMTRLKIGEVHFRQGIEPVWVMGIYLQYLEHLKDIISCHPAIKNIHRKTLGDIATQLLFRDMGILLEGYWAASAHCLPEEQQQAPAAQDLISSVLDNLPQLLWSYDIAKAEPVYISPNIELVSTQNIEMPIPCLSWTPVDERKRIEFAWSESLRGNSTTVETRAKSPQGINYWFRRVFHPYKDDHGNVIRIDGLMEDVTKIREAIDQIQTLATTDSLTGLLNRTLLQDRLEQAINLARRGGTGNIALILMDLDHFKEINDTLGHTTGDAILVMAAQRIQTVLRESDSLARLGGDEFAVLAIDGKVAENIAQKIIDCLNTAFVYNDNELYLGASLGISLYPDHGNNAEELMRRADVAMYASKQKGLGYLFYDAKSDPNTHERLQLASELRRALTENQLEIYYQPKIDLNKQTVDSIEALIRWNHPERGLLLPDQFLQLAEQTGLIKPITNWVLRTAAEQCLAWRQQGAFLRLAINVSGHIFQDQNLTEHIKRTLEGLGNPVDFLEIEITENELMSNVMDVSKTLRNLGELGITIAMDDFGTGYSSLAYLKELPLQTLKIDKSFVLNMINDDDDAVIVRSMIDLGHNLGRRVIAEGIENKDTWDLLSILGCDSAQGYYISEPLPAREFGRWLKKTSWRNSKPALL